MGGADAAALPDRYQAITAKMAACARGAGRLAEEVALVAVSKGQDAAAMRVLAEHLAGSGRTALFGESYVQEYRQKRESLPRHRVHYIGRLQRNKVKAAAALFDVIESASSLELVQAIDAAAAALGKCQNIFAQVNISGDPAKSGFAPEAVAGFIMQELPRFEHVRLCGLMTITSFYEEPEAVRPDFRAMAALHRQLKRECPALPADFHLSMGMSADFEIAVAEGATLVRVGTALFGEREPKSP